MYPNPHDPQERLSTPHINSQSMIVVIVCVYLKDIATGLAKESMMFTDAYAGAPVCAPSRCTLVSDISNNKFFYRYC